MSDTTAPTAPAISRLQTFPILGDDGRTRFAWRLRTADDAVCLVSGTRFTARGEARSDARKLKAAAASAVLEDAES